MSSARLAAIAERKALLATRAELDRARVTFAVHGVRAIVAPSPAAESLARARPTAALLVGLAGPLVGQPRLARWLRIASLALAAYRIARNWRTTR
jgi:hypothetical protein